MELTQELFQKCRRISAAIQDFLDKNIDAVALLLKRQPHIVEEKIKILRLM